MFRSCIALKLLLISGALAGCATSTVLLPHAIELVPPIERIPEEQLLDVAVQVFDPGVPEGEIDREATEKLLEQGIYISVRRSEAIHMAAQLRDALQKSGHWGTVSVTPTASMAVDLNLTAKILNSDGHVAHIRVVATDATGRTWLDKPYRAEFPASVYDERRYAHVDPYQDLFHSIANDLAALRSQLSAADAHRIRTISALRYGAELSPEALSGYVHEGSRGSYELVRLPAADDPFFDGARRVRQRERLFLETLGRHYDAFTARTAVSYRHWRKQAREDSLAIRDLTRSARIRKALGLTAMFASIGSIMNGGAGNAFTGRFLQESLLFMSTSLMGSSTARLEERRLHETALEELSTSFDEELGPLVVEIAGTERRLTGTAEAQYEQWQDLLRDLFVRETGMVPEDVHVYAEPAPP